MYFKGADDLSIVANREKKSERINRNTVNKRTAKKVKIKFLVTYLWSFFMPIYNFPMF